MVTRGIHRTRRYGRVLVVVTAIATAGVGVGCTPAHHCGAFVFNGTSQDGTDANTLPMSLSFDFDPAACSATCTCNTVVYIQMVRTVAMSDGTFLYASTEKQNRATADGWYIDRIDGRQWGYYGRNDSGTWASNLTPGSNATNAILTDAPSRPDSDPWLDIWWEAVSMPVCLDSKASCNNRFLGGYFWSWTVNPSGTMSNPITAAGSKELMDEMPPAVNNWNAQAGKNDFPAMSNLFTYGTSSGCSYAP